MKKDLLASSFFNQEKTIIKDYHLLFINCTFVKDVYNHSQRGKELAFGTGDHVDSIFIEKTSNPYTGANYVMLHVWGNNDEYDEICENYDESTMVHS